LQALVGIAIRAQKNLLLDPKHQSHEKAIASTLNRVGLGERQSVDVSIDGIVKVVDHKAAALEDYRGCKAMGFDQAHLEKQFGFSSVSPLEQQLEPQPKVIEHIPAQTQETTDG
jgi:hypothetical protein